MATQTSPGIVIKETDLTLSLAPVSLTEGAIAGTFRWGPVEAVQTVTSEQELVQKFWKPNDATADYFFTAANFLSYSNVLRAVRVVNENTARAATAETSATAVVDEGSSAITLTQASNAATTLSVIAGNNAGTLLFAGQYIVVANATATTGVLKVQSSSNTTVTLTGAVGTAVTAGNVYSYGVYVKNEDHYNETFADGSGSVGQWAAKYPGVLGNSLRVEMCASSNAFQQSLTGMTANITSANVTFSSNVAPYFQVGDIIEVTSTGERRAVTAIAANGTQVTVNAAFGTAVSANTVTREWAWASLFTGAPNTSSYVANLGGSNDELHIIVVDEDGLFSGAANTVLEKYEYLSKASDAKQQGASVYFKEVINRQSPYIWWMDNPSSGATNWGDTAASAFGQPALVSAASLNGGVDGTDVADADLIRGYDIFKDEQIELAFVLGASASTTLASYIISNVVEPRKYAMGFFSPAKSDVVNNTGNEVKSILAYRNALPSTSYAVLDTGWKYQYDAYNKVYRYVPLNGDVAGCAARTDNTSESWFSPAGFSRGKINNALKLAYNPRQADRDSLYVKGINPVITMPGRGTVLYGDKTLLSKPSAFDRINVRRLFIAIEKTIEQSASNLLFEQNDEFTRQSFISIVEPYLRSVRGRRGITDFLVVCDSTNNPGSVVDAGEFRADIFIKPVRSINYIQLNFVAVRSDVSFAEIATNIQ